MKLSSLVFAILGIGFAIGIGVMINNSFIDTAEPQQEIANNKSIDSSATSASTTISASSTLNSTNNLVFSPPSMDDVPDNKMKNDIIYGFNLVNETHIYAEENVGNGLSCTSCHAGAGLQEVASLVGVSANYPKYIARAGDIVTIEERINGCMVRSMNGTTFEANSDELEAMVAYFKYISEGVPIGAEREWAKSADMKVVPTPSISDGEALYQTSCIACHAADGSGNGANTGPALWGDDSFNDGAGLARLSKMAGYIQAYMPIGYADSLSDQDASNLAAYILAQDRPEWSKHDKDWPNGDKPSDIMTKERRDQIKDGSINWDEVLADFK